MLVEDGRDFPECADDALEGGRDVGEVGNTTADEEDLAVRVGRGAQHQVQHGAGVVVCLRLGRRARVLAVVGKLADEPGRGDGVGVDDRRTTTGHESPHAAAGVEDRQLERGTGLGIHVGDELLLFGHLTAKWRGKLHGRAGVDADAAVSLGESGQAQGGRAASNGPLGAALEIGGLIQLGGQIEEVDIGRSGIRVGDDDQGIDFEVGELAVDVDSVEAGDEVNEDIVHTLGNVLQKGGRNLLIGGVVLQVDGDEELLRFGIDITHVDTTLVGEENPVTLTVSTSSIQLNGEFTSRTELMLI